MTASPATIRAIRWGRLLLSVVGLVAAGLRIADLGAGQGDVLRESATNQLWPVLAVLVLSIGIRSRSVLQVAVAGLGGFFTAVWLAQVLGDVAIDQMGVDSPARLSVVVPVIEELAKLVPVAIVAFTFWRRRGSPGIVDFGLLGMASGAGFAIHEDALWSRVGSRGFDDPVGWVLSSTYESSANGVVGGHVVWTGVAGLAIGLWATRRRLVFAFAALAAVAAMVFDHGSWNLVSLRDDWRWLLLDGWLPVGLLCGGLVLAFVWDGLSVHRLPRGSRLTPLGVCRFSLTGNRGNPLSRLAIGSTVLRTAALVAHAREPLAAPVDRSPQPVGAPS